MFKRSNKITSLLVAAAAVVSLVPASAADVKKIDSKEGTIYNAVAYKDGAFYIDGEIEDKDENAYYLKDGKYNDIADVDSGDEVKTYGSKYLSVDNGDYFIDLTTGKSTDDDIAPDALDDAKTGLRSKLNKDDADRYAKGGATKVGDAVLNNTSFAVVEGNLFTDDYYEADIAKGTTLANGDTVKGTYHVYTDKSGKYIDADHNLGKVNVVYTTGKAATVKNTKDDDDTIRVRVSHDKTIAQDKDYIYRLVDLIAYKDTATANKKVDSGEEVNKFGSVNNEVQIKDKDGNVKAASATIKAIQKISKTQDSDDVDDAKVAKSTETYFFTDDGGKDKFNSNYDKYAVQDGKLTNYYVSTDGKKVYARTITLKSKNGYYYTDISDGADCDIEDAKGIEAAKVDVAGNVWVLDGGYIKKYNNDDDFDKVYKVDGSMNKLSVYDKDNMVAWNEGDETYSIIGGKSTKKEETTTTATTVPAVKAGWVQAADKSWSFFKADGTVATGWFKDNTGTWYFASAQGIMAASQWLQYGSDWYYVGGSGAMVTNAVVDGYTIGANGAWVR